MTQTLCPRINKTNLKNRRNRETGWKFCLQLILCVHLLGILSIVPACSHRNTGPSGEALEGMEEITMIEIAVDDFVFDARTAGPSDGEIVFLLHGFPQTSHSYHRQLKALGDAGYRAIAPDQRGYSPRARPLEDQDYRVDLLVEDIMSMVDKVGADRFHLVGHDWGAVVAWFVAGKYPDRLLSLTVLSVPHPMAFGAAFADPESEQAQMSSYMDFFRMPDSEDFFIADNAAQLRAIYAGVSEDDIDVYVEALGTKEALRAGLQWYRADNIETLSLGPVTTPTLFIWSDQDTALGRDGAEACGDYVEGPYRFEIFEGINHWIPDLAPDALTTLLLEHLRANPAGA
jgi:pimeloyl-ACP methyl ester carboxylesterase